MPIFPILIAVVVLSSVWWPGLPGWELVAVVVVLAGSVWGWSRGRNGALRCVAAALAALAFGVAWASGWGQLAINARLPESLDKSDFLLIGVVRGIPERDSRRFRFEFEIEEISGAGHDPPPLRRVQLSWYGQQRDLAVGERWQLQVRLRSPRGFSNPGGLDYGAWLLRRGIDATGYVRDGPNRRLGFASGGIDGLRVRTLRVIEELSLSAAAEGLLKALTVGDTRAPDAHTWEVLRATGTVHLAIVSGLHIGMVAGVGYLLGGTLGRFGAALGLIACRHTVAAWCAGGMALSYALLAGLSLPAQRALAMLGVVLIATLSRRRLRPGVALGWALLAVALVDPLAALSSGFWLSFAAVVVFVVWFSPRPLPGKFAALVLAQAVIFLPMSGFLLILQGEASLLAPPLNLLLVPWLSFGIVPPALFGAMMLPLGDVLSVDLSGFFWRLAGVQLEYLNTVLSWAANLGEYSVWRLPRPASWLTGLGLLLATGLLVLPAALGLRPLAGVLVLAVVLMEADTRKLGLHVAVLDVGQGLAVVLHSDGETLVYDTGPGFSERFDAGSAIVAPYLRRLGVSQIDTLVLSHGDSDHVGGTAGLRQQMPVARTVAGQLPVMDNFAAELCIEGQKLDLGAARVSVLWPPASETQGDRRSDNDSSCVLLVEFAGRRVLLPGDISSQVEAELVSGASLPAGIDVVVAPHHGSKTSSSSGFVGRLSPAHVIFSAGFRHHFGHPADEVRQRYTAVGSRQWSTAEHGAILLDIHLDGGLQMEPWRARYRPYWKPD